MPHTSLNPDDFIETMEFIEKMKRSSSIEDVSSAFEKHVSKMGFYFYSCLVTDQSDNELKFRTPVLHWPENWLDHYFAEKYELSDPIIKAGRLRRFPITWTEMKAQGSLTRQERFIFDAASEIGILDGIAVPVHGLDRSFGSVYVAGENENITSDTMNLLQMMAMYMHSTICRVHPAEPAVNTMALGPLSERERECLVWVMSGKSDTDIGDILNISHHTVHFHIENVKRKFDVATRAQAIVQGIVTEQVHP